MRFQGYRRTDKKTDFFSYNRVSRPVCAHFEPEFLGGAELRGSKKTGTFEFFLNSGTFEY